MQEFDFIPSLGVPPKKFWQEVGLLAKENDADPVLTYMNLMIAKARIAKVPVRLNDFKQYGHNVELYEGVSTWFKRINDYGHTYHIKVEHFIISSGLRDMISGTPIAKHFKKIFASGFVFDENNVAQWPAVAVNFTTKTQYLFRINKGKLDVHDDREVNDFVPDEERPIPFSRIVFVGDGQTDIPCFRLVKAQGGHSIAVFKPNGRNAKQKVDRLLEVGRVNFVCPADYSEDSQMEKLIKAIIDKIATDVRLLQLNKRN